MSLKSRIKSVIGEKTISNVRANIKYIKTWRPVNCRVSIYSDNVIDKVIIGKKGAHVFCGYFDIDPQNPNNANEFLVHILPVGSQNGNDPIGIGIANIQTKEIKQLVTTKAWCWQMGARLRWSKQKGLLIFNSYDEANGYRCMGYDTINHTSIQIASDALYDISGDERFGLSINFERLQALRPGYGYCCCNSNVDEQAPSDDGLYFVDLLKGEKRLLVSLKRLSELYPNPSAGYHYINHISISPDSENAIFFHIWTCKEMPGWKANLCNINIATGEIKYLEKNDQVSHYDWKNNDEILITAVDKEMGVCNYRIYNIKTGNKKVLSSDHLCQDGHPVFSMRFEGFYSDTYPDKYEIQKLFKCSKQTGYEQLAAFYSDPRMHGEKRCDLHPHYFKNSENVAVDSTFSSRRRQVCVLSLSKNEGVYNGR